MANKNEKPINYGNLSRFYQNLKNNDLSDLNDKIDNIDVPEYTAGEGIEINSANTISCSYQYTLPTASNNTLGGVKVGESLEINNGVLSLNHNLMKSIYDLLPEKEQYLTFEADEDNCDIYFCNWSTTSSDFRTVYVSKDLENWTAKTSSKGSSTSTTSKGTLLATLNKGEKLFVKGNNNDYSPGNGNIFAPRKKCMIYGNLLSIVSERDFDKIDTLTGGFRAMFSDNDNIINHPTKKIIISLKNYNASQYNGFYGMFRNCHSLTKSPIILNIENINAPYCFGEMFQNCTSLSDTEGINISNISSISGSYAFARMFQGCTSLTNIPQNTMPSVTSNYCGYNMFQGCTSLTTASELPATTLADYCYSSMFYGCTSLTTAPALPASTLANDCYEDMFHGCTSLNYIKCLATDISATNCTYGWVYGVQTNSGTFVKHPDATSWTTGNNGIPSNWTVENAIDEISKVIRTTATGELNPDNGKVTISTIDYTPLNNINTAGKYDVIIDGTMTFQGTQIPIQFSATLEVSAVMNGMEFIKLLFIKCMDGYKVAVSIENNVWNIGEANYIQIDDSVANINRVYSSKKVEELIASLEARIAALEGN